MDHKIQIIVPSRLQDGPRIIPPRLSFWQRFKLLIAGVGVAVVGVAVVLLVLFLGSVLFALLLVVLIAVIVALVIKATFKRARRQGH